MATLATYFNLRKGAAAGTSAPAIRAEPCPYQLRALPNEDVFFYCKRIDNSRLVRQPDPRATGANWTVIGAACAIVALLSAALAPGVANTFAGYRVQELQKEQARLMEERRTLQLEEARLRSLTRLDELARQQKLVTPTADQIVHLEARPDSSFASLKK